MQETWDPSLGQEDPLEKEMATHSSILAWEIPWTGSLAGYNLWGHKRIRQDLTPKQQQGLQGFKLPRGPERAAKLRATGTERPWSLLLGCRGPHSPREISRTWALGSPGKEVTI